MIQVMGQVVFLQQITTKSMKDDKFKYLLYISWIESAPEVLKYDGMYSTHLQSKDQSWFWGQLCNRKIIIHFLYLNIILTPLIPYIQIACSLFLQELTQDTPHRWPLLLTWFNFNPSMDK